MPRHSRPTVGAAIIVKDGGDLFKKCLASIKDHVDEIAVVVDSRTVDDSRAIARSFGAKTYDFDWIDDFSAARNESFRHIKSDWILWVDSDDTVEGLEYLPDLLQQLHPRREFIGVWCPYWYHIDEHGNRQMEHTRERIVRMSVGWEWQNRVHETLAPKFPGIWYEESRIIWKHWRPAGPQTERNLRLLYLMLAENPDNPRTWMGLGNQYHASGEWQKALDWLERFYMDTRPISFERWQAMCYASRCHRRLEQYDKALQAAWLAISLEPAWADGYLQLAESYGGLGDFKRAAFWAEKAKDMAPPPSMAMRNYLEEQAEPSTILSYYYSGLGKWDKALEECNKALALIPHHEALKSNQKIFQESLIQSQRIDAYINMAASLKDREKLRLAVRLDGLVKEPLVRDVTIPAIMRLRSRGSQPRITFVCGQTLETWTAETPNTRGIGASETAVVEVANRLAQVGWRTDVYNHCGNGEGIYDQVLYADYRRWRPEFKTDVLVAWRFPMQAVENAAARERWLWLHDLNKGLALTEENTKAFDKVLGVSQFHASYLEKVYPFFQGKMGYVNNGINLERFLQKPEKQAFKVAWTSSPDRGLIHLLELWPFVIANEPKAELHVFYGWENIDKVIEMGNAGLVAFKAMIQSRMEKMPSVKWRGRVPQPELAKELATSDVWAYPTSFVETFCVGALEAMAAGAIPVTSDLGNLPGVIGDAGFLIPGNPGSEFYRARFVRLLLESLLDVETIWTYRPRGPERAKEFTWDKALEQWMAALKSEVLV